MKMKSWVLWLLVVVFLVSEGLLFSTICQKNALVDSLAKSQQQATDLQTQMDQLKTSMAAAQNAELSKLRADNQDLPRLRNQVTQLQAANAKLKQQYNSTLTAAQQQQSQLAQVTAENKQVRTEAQQWVVEVTERNACLDNLRKIDAAKQQWALLNSKTVLDVPTVQDIISYFPSGTLPVCPSGGIYTIGAVGVSPTCSISGHVLP